MYATRQMKRVYSKQKRSTLCRISVSSENNLIDEWITRWSRLSEWIRVCDVDAKSASDNEITFSLFREEVNKLKRHSEAIWHISRCMKRLQRRVDFDEDEEGLIEIAIGGENVKLPPYALNNFEYIMLLELRVRVEQCADGVAVWSRVPGSKGSGGALDLRVLPEAKRPAGLFWLELCVYQRGDPRRLRRTIAWSPLTRPVLFSEMFERLFTELWPVARNPSGAIINSLYSFREIDAKEDAQFFNTHTLLVSFLE